MPEMGNTADSVQKFIDYKIPFERPLDFEIRGKEVNRKEAIEYYGVSGEFITDALDNLEETCNEIWYEFLNDIDSWTDTFLIMIAEQTGCENFSTIEEEALCQLAKLMVVKYPDDSKLQEVLQARVAGMPSMEDIERMERERRNRN